ncbi:MULTISPECIES: hypothetical protein [Halorussus]|uniref:hypothetical protein n=1 Tax=Halorussus TaxID=1070314 RepID=UPI00209EA103|nr:hypothetical protein [Halorussus vallis]USZ78711.1 hypothetical protein NGM07_24685 [Halorussus vallis]
MSDDDDETFVTELEFIQNVIDRQADNSFKVKGWTITLVVVTLLFRTSDSQIIVAFIPLFAFWYLDAYYLKLERQYRKLYNHVRENRDNAQRDSFSMDSSPFKNKVKPIWRIMVSRSVIILYGTILVLLVIYAISVYSAGDPTGQAANAQTTVFSLLW